MENQRTLRTMLYSAKIYQRTARGSMATQLLTNVSRMIIKNSMRNLANFLKLFKLISVVIIVLGKMQFPFAAIINGRILIHVLKSQHVANQNSLKMQGLPAKVFQYHNPHLGIKSPTNAIGLFVCICN